MHRYSTAHTPYLHIRKVPVVGFSTTPGANIQNICRPTKYLNNMITTLIVLIGTLCTMYIACQQDVLLLTTLNEADIFTQTAQSTVFYHPPGEDSITSSWPLLHSGTSRLSLQGLLLPSLLTGHTGTRG